MAQESASESEDDKSSDDSNSDDSKSSDSESDDGDDKKDGSDSSDSDGSDSSDSDEDKKDVGMFEQNMMFGHPVATVWNKDHPHPGYQANHDDFEGTEGFGKYDRIVPERFAGPGSGNDADDQFMNSMINKYAVELATPTGTPTGQFVFRKENAMQAAYEILETHMSLTGEKAQKYLDEYFDKTWKHFDTANDGNIEAARMSGFYRFLTGNMQIDLH